MKKKWKILISIILLTVAAAVIFITAVYEGAFGSLQSKDDLLNFKSAIASVVLSDNGELIGRIFSENRTNISYDEIPSYLINALIATEDVRFFTHEGIDSRSILRVLVKTLLFNKHSSGGGSTISQQLAKNMFGRNNYGILTLPVNKVKEAFLANRLEKVFTKEEILTLYLNTVSFGENVYGIEVAASRYFNKKVDSLRIEESAVLVGILKANDYYNPRLHPENSIKRRNVVLNQMKKYHYLDDAETDSLCRLPLIQNYANIESAGPADYFLYQVKTEARELLQNINSEADKKWNIEADGLIIETTLNIALQNYANQSFHDHLSVMQKKLNDQYESASGRKIIQDMTAGELEKLNLTERANEIGRREVFDWNGSFADSISVADSLEYTIRLLHAGLLALDPFTGSVKAWVGGIDFKIHPYDQILARRQLASTFKPILYADAFEEGMKPCQYLDNDSVMLTDYIDWTPENFDHSYGGTYSLVGALSNSMNVPTFNLFMSLDFGKLDSLWQRMGFIFPLNNRPSLAMGTAEASIREVAIAYSSFANGGYKITPHSILSIRSPDGEVIWQNDSLKLGNRIMAERTSILISAILQKAVREGTGVSMSNVYGVTLPLAGKTGTSQDYADAWFTAFNPSLVIVSRVGASSPAIHFNTGSNGSGSTLALPLVALTLKKVQMNRDLSKLLISSFPPLPPDLAEELDCVDTKEKTFIDKVKALFRKDKITFGLDTLKSQNGKIPFLKRLFGKRNRK